MNRTIRITMSNACMALAATLCVFFAGNARAADDGVTQAAAEPQQLDEIWVYGKSLSRRIEDAENKMFKRYNKLNKNHDYDVVCGTVSLHPGSMIMKRSCQPGFVVNYAGGTGAIGFGNSVYVAGYSSYNQPCTSTNGMIGQTDMTGQMYWVWSGCSPSPAPYITYLSPPASPRVTVTKESREKYAKNFIKVVITDTSLLDMAEGLTRLYAEMDEIQGRYQAAKDEANARRRLERQSMKPVTGPRGL
jgi:hypothetical protein